MNVIFYSYTKRENSTAVPSAASGTTYTGKLREPCNITSPEIGFDLGIAAAPTFNYAYIQAFGDRYYWVTEWTWDSGLWWASMKVDVLASYRGTIGSSTEYILRSASASDGYVVDNLYPATANITNMKTAITPFWNGSDPWTGGGFVLGLVGQSSLSVGAVTYYWVTLSEIRDLMNELLSSTAWTGQTFTNGLSLDGLTEETFKALLNPMQYIVSCQWAPVLPTLTQTATPINIGWWTLTTAVGIEMPYVSNWYTRFVALPKHPQEATRGEYLQMAPYSRYRLRIPPFGTIELNSSLYVDRVYLCIWLAYDFITGKATMVYGPANANTGNYPDVVDGVVEAQTGVPIALAQSSQDILGAFVNTTSALAGGIASAVTGDLGGAITNGVSGIANAINNFMPSISITGGNGSFANFVGETCLLSDFIHVVQADNAHLGSPLCRPGQISNYTGYLLIADPDIAISGTASEAQEIKQYMSSGFYYE